MEIFKYAGLCVLTVLIITLFKQQKSEYAIVLSIVFTLILLSVAAEKLGEIIAVMSSLYDKTNLPFIYFETILKVLCLCYVGYFASGLAKDAGEEGIAANMEIFTKILVVFISLPVITSFAQAVLKLI